MKHEGLFAAVEQVHTLSHDWDGLFKPPQGPDPVEQRLLEEEQR
jgi:hypothetical protein